MKHLKVLISILYVVLFLPNILHAASVWNVAADGLSATLQPSAPYDNYSDTSTTLSIASETVLYVTINGESEKDYDFLDITDASGNTQSFDGTVNTTYQVNGSSITIRFTSDYSITSTGFSVSIRPNTPPVANAGADQNVFLGTPIILDASGSSDANGPIANWSWSENGTTLATGQTANISLPIGTHTITLTVTDSDGQTATDTVSITITAPPLVAVADNFNATIGNTTNGNLLANDSGVNIVYVANSATNPSYGTVVISSDGQFVYTPNSGFTGTDTFTYSITDDNGATATATVSIFAATNYAPEGFQDFDLVNPPSTRNVLGNYAIAGNTIMCLTEKTSGYGGTCHGEDDYQNITSNLHVSKYLDIDNDNSTWNSTSSYINLPINYNQDNGNGIIWAGLFWQGRFSTDEDAKLRYGVEDGNSYDLVEIGKNSSDYDEGDTINVSTLGANTIKLKIDNGSYTASQASEVFTYVSSNGVTYAAQADVTLLLQDANLSQGKHVFTVANLATAEGREYSPGVFGGWSLIVIYKEFASGDTRNISVYHGFQSLGSHPDPIHIAGFKLPVTGDVSSQATVFSGEGEYLYGKNPDNSDDYDWMKISNELTGTYLYMPGPTNGTHVGNRDNMFDAKLTGILRDAIDGKSNNLQKNNDGVDIDVFDVSDIMTTYRDANSSTNEIFLKVDSNNDYVTPSMIAFSTELYKPKVCYDYTIQKNGFDITNPDENRTIHSIGQGDLSFNIALQSEEGDFDFERSQLSISLNPLANTAYVNAKYAPNNVNTLIPAIETTNHTNIKPTIAIGENITMNGGTIKRNQRYFAEFNYHVDSAIYEGSFELDLNTTLDFGSGPVPVLQSTLTGEIERCPQSPYYNPIKGAFNIERPGSTGNPNEKFPLFTQVVGKDFDFEVVAYNQSAEPPFSTEIGLDGYTVDIELINASPFSDVNSSFVCDNPNTNIIQNLDTNGTKHVFAQFENNNSRIDLSYLNIQTDTALRNAAFRIYYIVDNNNTILKYDCPFKATEAAQETCFEDLYSTHLQADDNAIVANTNIRGFCKIDCTDGLSSGTSNCYQCLRNYFSHPVCSRDNFAIRPASYRIDIVDSNQSQQPDILPFEITLGSNISTNSVATIAAGYKYKLKGMSTSYLGTDVKALGYNRKFENSTNNAFISKLLFQDSGPRCVDENDTKWDIRFLEGEIVGLYTAGQDTNISSGDLVKHSNVGNYQYYLHDANWTEVDHQDFAYKTFDSQDCIENSNIIGSTPTSQSGCDTDSNLTGNGDYENLALTYKPYKFDISHVYLHTTTPNANYMYMNDFEHSYYNDAIIHPLTMATLVEGNVTAKGADDIITTNFKNGCVIHDVILDLNRTMTPTENTIRTENGDLVKFQQYLQVTPLNNNYDFNTSTSLTGNTAIKNSTTTRGFSDVNPGSSPIRLFTNLKKIIGYPDCSEPSVNPVDINYTSLEVKAPNAATSVNLADRTLPNNYRTIPRGVRRYTNPNSVIKVFYSKINANNLIYDQLLSDYQTSMIYVDIASDAATAATHDLNITSTSGQGGWYSARHYYNALHDGNVTFSTAVVYGIGAQSKVSLNGQDLDNNDWIKLDNPLDSMRNDINLSMTNDIRPADIDLIVRPQPWHEYKGPPSCDNAGALRIRHGFIHEGTWAGVGSTGNVVETGSSNMRTPRMNW